jgi:SAM-dependent methyltransferase
VDSVAPVSAYTDIVRAYEGVERLEEFTVEQLAAYREQLLERTHGQAEFMAQRTPTHASVVEIASGNGRLLIALARRVPLRQALGIDASASRIEFAREWARDLGLERVRFETADALTRSLPDGLDVIVCITGAFGYFDAMQPGAGARLLERARTALSAGGLLILELYPHPSWRRMLQISEEHELRLWQELPERDPWRFYLSHLRFSPDTQILTHRKTFVHRTSGEIDVGRSEHVRLHDRATVEEQLRAAGFAGIAAYGDWSGRAHQTGDELLILTGLRA